MTLAIERNEVLLHDPRRQQWLHFRQPRCVIATSDVHEIQPLIRETLAQARTDGLYAAGFLSYEAAPAFDAAFTISGGGDFPLVWLGLYPSPEAVTLPAARYDYPRQILEWKPSVSRATYRRAIRKIKEQIAAGQTYQVNYTLRMRAALAPDSDSWAYFLALVQAQEPPYGAYIHCGRYVICSASPELFFTLENGLLTSRPMKGTAPRGLTWHSDQDQAAWLRNSEKNRAENVMIVDMIRNDMGRVAETGSVAVPQLFTIEKYPTVWQMTSTVTARTRSDVTGVLEALFPCASITGAPKRSTMQIIAQLEREARRIYTGSIGYVSPEGDAQFSVAIRTVLVDRQMGIAEYGVGGGVVWESTDDGEWEECATKTRILTQQRPRFDLLETMLWRRKEGYLLLDYHLERLKRSAAYFDYPFDTSKICGQLQESARAFENDAQRVRLTLAKGGQVALEATALEYGERNTVRVCLAPAAIQSDNPFLYHKTTNREIYNRILASCPDYEDVILWNERGEITESCLASVVIELDGERITPPISSGLLPGTYRQWLLNQGLVREQVVCREDLQRCSQLWLVNSVRGERRALLEPAQEILEAADAR